MNARLNNERFHGPVPDVRYTDYLANGEFRIQKCGACGHHMFFPRVLSTKCGAPQLGWVEANGRGTAYSRTTIAERPEKGGPRNLSVIELDEGPRMFSRVEGVAPEAVHIGLAVRARIADGDAALSSSSIQYNGRALGTIIERFHRHCGHRPWWADEWCSG